MNTQKLISIIIVTCDAQKFLDRCLSSVFLQDYHPFEVIVVDNGSSAEGLQWLRENYPQIHLIKNGENIGYCTATNRGIQHSKGEYIVVLDDDTEMEAGFLAALVTVAESGNDVGLVASQVVLDDDPTLIDSAGIEVDWAGVAWNRQVGLPVADEPEEPIDVFGSTGAGGLYVKKMLDQIGLLDDDFFIYYDDADIAWRGQRAGWRCVYTPQARLRHIHSGTSGKWSSFKAYLLGRNKIWTMVKNYPLKSFLLHLPVILFFELAAIFYALIFFKDTAALRGRLSAIRHISIPLAKRKQFNQTVNARPVQLAPVPSLKSAWKKHRSIPRNT